MSRKAGTPNKKKVELKLENIPTIALDKNNNPDFGACLTSSDKLEIPSGYKDDKFEISKEDVKNFLPPSGKDMLKETMPKYFIVESHDKNILKELVINAMDMNCVCQGGVSVTCYRDVNGIEFVYCQAMVKRDSFVV